MIKMILGFLVLFALVFAAIEGFTAVTGRERIQLIKSLGYATIVAAVVVLIITAIVVLF